MIMTMENSRDESALMKSARRGSLEAFNQLVLEYQDAAWNLAFHLLWNETKAMAVVQKAVQELYRELWLLGRRPFRLNLYNRVVRSCQRILKDESNHLQPDTLKMGEGAASARLSVLPLPERIVLVLSELEGLGPREISEITETPVSLVRERLGKALAACL